MDLKTALSLSIASAILTVQFAIKTLPIRGAIKIVRNKY